MLRHLARLRASVSARAFSSGQGSTAQRSDHFARLLPDDVAVFRDIVGEGVITDSSTLQKANRDWIGKYEGKSEVLLQPRSVSEVSAILQHCNTRKLAVVPQGGNTGLVGGSVPVFDEIILSTAKLNEIKSMDAISGALVAGAGCTLQQCDDAAAEAGCIVPLDLGPRSECHIGGNVSSNAGGLRVVRYGSLHGSVLGIQAVLPDGTVLEDLATLKKDNTGYDLKQLFIGAEGTLGVVTSVAVQCPPRSRSRQVAVLAVPSFHHAQQLLRTAKAALGEIMSAFEFLDQQALQLTLQHLPEASDPMPGKPAPIYVLLETSGSNEAHDHAKLQAFTKQAEEAGLAAGYQVAHDRQQMEQLWGLRTGISVALHNAGPVYKYDFSLPLPQIYDLVEATRSRLAHLPATVVSYGHLGDGNLHLNISTQQYSPELEAALEPFVYQWVADRGGSISAEHGLGQMKNHMLGYTKPEPMVRMMTKIKQVFDPNGIMNPYKMLPS